MKLVFTKVCIDILEQLARILTAHRFGQDMFHIHVKKRFYKSKCSGLLVSITINIIFIDDHILIQTQRDLWSSEIRPLATPSLMLLKLLRGHSDYQMTCHQTKSWTSLINRCLSGLSSDICHSARSFPLSQVAPEIARWFVRLDPWILAYFQ